MKILDGKATAQRLRQVVAGQVAQARAAGHRPPHLAAILVGQHPASRAYVRNKMRACAEVGYRSSLIELPDSISQAEMLAELRSLNAQADLDGYILQLPLPPQLEAQALIECIDPGKDADGVHPYKLGLMTLGQETLLPATP